MKTLVRVLLALCLCCCTALGWALPALPLDDQVQAVDGWPAVTALRDPSAALGLDDVRRRRDELTVPTVPHANFGVKRAAVWLYLPVQVTGQGRWVMEIDYAPLNRVDVHLVTQGRPAGTWRLGNDQPFDQRPLQSRGHAVALELPTGPHELWLRVHTSSSMLVPIRFYRADAFVVHEARGQIVQGLMFGMALALLVYTLVNGLGLRDPLFAQYGAMLLGVGVFLLGYTGIGQQYLWNEQTGLLANLSPMSILLALAGGSLFAINALGLAHLHPHTTRALQVMSAVATLGLVATAAGLMDYRQAQTLASLMGPLPMAVQMPPILAQARRGDRTAQTMLLGWGVYLVGALTMVGLLRGLLPVTFWLQQVFQIASLLEMLAWVRVLGLRVEAVQRQADRAEAERHALHSLAHTDALTGLPNRRGLSEALAAALPHSGGGRALAVYLLDLDGFKAVNDRLGHDAGDSLLIQVGQRLRSLVRQGDVVARLGGDEFVVMAPGIGVDPDAQALGRKLVDAFRQPFDVAGQRCAVGLTAGYALAPQDGVDAAQLLKQADAAMYAGKQAGRRCVRRGGVSAPGLVAG